jgi:arginine utilization protein RocB
MIDEEMLELTKRMVSIPSVNGTEGEKDIGLFVEQYIRSFPYFQAHPDQVTIVHLKDDPLDRRSILALLRGEKDDNPGTVILHGHTDTVGIEDFGAFEPYATDPDQLERRLYDVALPAEVRRDLESGDFMFGRGSCDMKSGDAVFMTILRRFSEHPEDFSGNLILSLNPVEENMHTGIIEALPYLVRWKQQYHLHLTAALNNDFVAPLYPGDPQKTIYTGIGGKLLPCFYIQGKETHVGQCFEGFDASRTAAELVRRIHLSMDFADTYEGETTCPPSVLKMKDLKTWYNVQTAKEALVYFNYYVHDESVESITGKLTDAAKEAFREVLSSLNKEYRRFCLTEGLSYEEKHYEVNVLTYDELYEKCRKGSATDDSIDAQIRRIILGEKSKGKDVREIPVGVIRYLLQKAGIVDPVIVLYYAPPYCPHSTLKKDNAAVLGTLQKAAEETSGETGDEFRFMRFYPSLSDSSYLRIDDNDDSIRCLIRNFPGFSELYPLPVDAIRALNVPAVNIGCYGADAHKWTERVYKPYTFGTLPKLEVRIINMLLELTKKK